MHSENCLFVYQLKKMSSKRSNLKALIGSGSRSVQLVRGDSTSPVGKYFASIRINGQSDTDYNCCVMCKQLLKRGKTCPILQWKHKTRHLARGEKYSDKELEEIVRRYNKQTSPPMHEGVSEQLQCPSMSNKEPIQLLNFPNILPSQDKVMEIPNEPLCPYVSPLIKFSHPTTIMIAGPTFSGKTTFVRRMLHENMIEPAPQRIIWIYKENYRDILNGRMSHFSHF